MKDKQEMAGDEEASKQEETGREPEEGKAMFPKGRICFSWRWEY